MRGSVTQPRGVFVVEAFNIRSGIAHIPHLLLANVMGDRDSSPSSTTKTKVNRWLAPISRVEHLSRFKPDLLTNRPKATEAKST